MSPIASVARISTESDSAPLRLKNTGRTDDFIHGTPELTADEVSPPSSADPVTPQAFENVKPPSPAQWHTDHFKKTEISRAIPHMLPSPPVVKYPNIDLPYVAETLLRRPWSSKHDPLPYHDSFHDPGMVEGPHNDPLNTSGVDTRAPSQQQHHGNMNIQTHETSTSTSVHYPPNSSGQTILPASQPHQAPLPDNMFNNQNEGRDIYWTINPFHSPVTRGANFSPVRPPSAELPQVSPNAPVPTGGRRKVVFFMDKILRNLYLHLLLRLPLFYYSRLTRLFHDVEMGLPDMKRLAMANWAQRHGINHRNTEGRMINISNVHPKQSQAFQDLKVGWGSLIDSLMLEWQTSNIVSVLLLSAILTSLQINGIATDPVTRNTALVSLICALMSLLYGCMYIVRFVTMRKTYKAIEWAQESQKSNASIFWNVWVLLAMPAVWLSWSIIVFIAGIMAYVWRIGSDHDVTSQISPSVALIPRLVITGLFVLGMIYFALIVNTLSRYGDTLDASWKVRVNSWIKNLKDTTHVSVAPEMSSYTFYAISSSPASAQPGSLGLGYPTPSRPRISLSGSLHGTPTGTPVTHPATLGNFIPSHASPLHTAIKLEENSSALHSHPDSPPFSYEIERIEKNPGTVQKIQLVKFLSDNPFEIPWVPLDRDEVYGLEFNSVEMMTFGSETDIKGMPEVLAGRSFRVEDWERCTMDLKLAWKNQHPIRKLDRLYPETLAAPLQNQYRPQDYVATLLYWWNKMFFSIRETQALLCELFLESSPEISLFGIYLVDLRGVDDDTLPSECFGSTPEGFYRVDIYEPHNRHHPMRLDNTLLTTSLLPTHSHVLAIGPMGPRTFGAFRILSLRAIQHPVQNFAAPSIPLQLLGRSVSPETWNVFITAMQGIRFSALSQCLDPYVNALEAWNTQFFYPRMMQVVLGIETLESEHEPDEFQPVSVYLTDLGSGLNLGARFGHLPRGVSKVIIYRARDPVDSSKFLGRIIIKVPKRNNLNKPEALNRFHRRISRSKSETRNLHVVYELQEKDDLQADSDSHSL